jgi:hypothetical protein
VLTDKHVSIKLHLKRLDAVVTPTILFRVVTTPLIRRELISLQALQTRMMRSFAGWARIEDESWRGTMARMRGRMQAALQCCPIARWTTQVTKKQFGSGVVFGDDCWVMVL